MRKWLWLIASFVSGNALASGALVVQPQANGEIEFYTEGSTNGGGADSLSVLQPPGKALTMTVSASGLARCEAGSLKVDTLGLKIQLQPANVKISCGDPLFFPSSSEARSVRVRVAHEGAARDFSGLLRMNGATRSRIGNVSFALQDGENVEYPLYLDMAQLRQEAVTLSASFDKTSLQFGLVGQGRDATASANLRVGKTALAGSEALPYRLTFESSQLKAGRYRMRLSAGEVYIPYKIDVKGTEVLPDSPYRGQIPPGVATSVLLNITLSLAGKSLHGMPAGARLLDTLTAVVTPEI